jgi:hypothetical protein
MNRQLIAAVLVLVMASAVPSVLAQGAFRETLLSAGKNAPGTLVTVRVAAPIFVRPDLNYVPLRVAREGSVLKLIEQDDAWMYVEFADPQYGRRIGYIQTQFVRVIPWELVEPPIDLSVPEGQPFSQPVPPVSVPTPSRRTEPRLVDAPPLVPSTRREESPSSTVSMAALDANDIAVAQRQGLKAKGRFTGLLLTDSGRAVANGIMSALAAMDNRPSTPGPYGTGFAVSVFTPQTWLAQHVGNALREYRPFDLDQLDPDFYQPVLRVTGIPDLPTYVTGRGLSAADSVKRVVVTDEKRSLIIQPLTQEEYGQTVSSAFRDANFSGAVVTFPLEGVDAVRRLSSKREFLIIVIGYGTEKVFKVKTKHFKSIPYHSTVAR